MKESSKTQKSWPNLIGRCETGIDITHTHTHTQKELKKKDKITVDLALNYRINKGQKTCSEVKQREK